MPGSRNNRRSLNIALIGGSGFVGRNLVPVLAAQGHHCTVFSRNPARCREIRLLPGVGLRQVNVHDQDELNSALAGHDAVVNLVGILNESGRSGKGFEKAHVALTEKLIAACHENGISRLVHVSALGADTQSPNASHYLKSKARAEKLLNESSLDTTIFRPSVIFGVDDSFFNRFAGLLKWLPVLPLACPNARMQPVWVGDVVNAIGKSFEMDETIGRTYTLVGGITVRLIDVVRFTAKTMGKKRLIIGLPDFVSRVQGLVCDFVPGKPFSSDNYRSLKIDNISKKDGLKELGIDARPMAGLVGSYLGGSVRQKRLDTYRRHARHQD